MNKIKIILITILAVVGALLIYNHFDKMPKEKDNINRFSKEYTLVSENNIYKYITIDEAINILSTKSGIVFFCTPESEWCQKYALYLNDAVMETGEKEINYLNIKDYREVNSIKYERLLEILDNYIYKDDINNKKIFMPDLSFVNNGIIVAHDNETSLVQSDEKIDNYWTDSKIKDFKNKIKNYVILMNEPISNEEEEGEIE